MPLCLMAYALCLTGDLIETYSVMNYVLRDGEMHSSVSQLHSVEVFKCCTDGLERIAPVIWPEHGSFSQGSWSMPTANAGGVLPI